MQAFIDTPITKERFIHHLKWHQEQDKFIKGDYGEYFKNQEDFKGCAVGCSLNSVRIELGDFKILTSSHKLYESYFGVPEWLARVEDRIFEGLPTERAKQWPLEFGQAINIGADLDKIKPPFFIFIIESVLEYVQDGRFKKQKEAIENVISLYKNGETDLEEFRTAAADAADAAYAAYATADAADAAYATADAADAAYATADAADAAYAAAAAAYASYAAAADAAAADATAAAAAAAAYATAAARQAKYTLFADKLLELMRECK